MNTPSSPASSKSISVTKNVADLMLSSFFAAMYASVLASSVPPRQ